MARSYPVQSNQLTLSSGASAVFDISPPTPGQEISLDTQTANTTFSGPTSGGAAVPTFRALVTADLPAGVGTVTNVTGTSPITSTGGATPDIGLDQAVAIGNNARVAVAKNSGATVGTRRKLNFIEGANITLTVTDDVGGEEVEVTIAATDTDTGITELTGAVTAGPGSGSQVATLASGIDATKIADGTVTSTEFQYINTLSSNAQTQIDLKAPLASPTFTGTVTIPTPFTLGAVSVTPTGTELNFVDGVTSGIQGQLDAKQTLDAQLTSLAALSYAGNTLKVIRVNAGETDFELAAPGGLSDGTYGQIVVSGGGLVWTLTPTATQDFLGQQASNFRIENRTSDPGAPTVGQIWLRTDL